MRLDRWMADPDFLDSQHLLTDRGTYVVTRRPAPVGWVRREWDCWVGLAPASGAVMAGWTIVVTGLPADAEEILNLVWNFCVSRRLPFRFAPGSGIVRMLNDKTSELPEIAGLAAISARSAQATQVAGALSGMLASRPGPGMTGWRRVGRGPVHVREDTGPLIAPAPGASTAITSISPAQPARAGPDTSAAALLAALSGSAYRLDRALHEFNGGGVWLGREVASGRVVVIKYAQPWAACDSRGLDAVARLGRERAALALLAGTGLAPELIAAGEALGYQYFAETWVPGMSLARELSARYPLRRPGVSAADLAAYRDWVTEITSRAETALSALHCHGVVHGDLAPGNIIIGPGGSVTFIDFESAYGIGSGQHPAVQTLGFAAPAAVTGPDADRHSLACLRLAAFVPLTELLGRDPAKGERLITEATRLFSLPTGFASKIRGGLKPAATSCPASQATSALLSGVLAPTDPGFWLAFRDEAAAAIAESATPGRDDQLFPGGLGVQVYGGLGLAHGAAGVLYALHAAGVAIKPEHLDWLARHALAEPRLPRGLFTGTAGIAVALARLDRPDQALSLFTAEPSAARAFDLFDGLAGDLLAALYLARTCDQPRLRDHAHEVARQLASAITAGAPEPAGQCLPRKGLLGGPAGIALALVRQHEESADPALLDAAALALRRELADTTFQPGKLPSRDGRQLPVNLAYGGSGTVIALHAYLRHRRDPDFGHALREWLRACAVGYARQPGLWHGRAGRIAALTTVGEARAGPSLRDHLRMITAHALPWHGHLAFPGESPARLSMDLATGTAGILHTVGAALNQIPESLPLLGPSAGQARSRASGPASVDARGLSES